MRDLARMEPIMPDPSRPVVFVAPTPDLFGMARMFELQGAESRPNPHVVRTAEEAYQVLNVRQPPFVPVLPFLIAFPAHRRSQFDRGPIPLSPRRRDPAS